MESKKNKRGRPRKNPMSVKTEPSIKRARGRPKIKSESFVDAKDIKPTLFLDEIYREPKVLRKIRVFRFDKSVFHLLSKKFGGNIIEMSFVTNELMNMYINNKIKIDDQSHKQSNYYYEWCKGSPPIEPIVSSDLSQAHALTRGIPLQYKYSLIIDENVYNKFQKYCDYYPQFLVNLLVKMYLDEKNEIIIDTTNVHNWCNL